MTPTMDQPVDTGAPEATTDSVLDDIAGMLTSDGTEETPPGEAPAQDTPGQVTEPSDGEHPQAETEQTPAEGEYQLAEDGQNYLVPKDEMASIKTLKEYSSKVQEWFPTVQDAETARVHASTARQMYNDFTSGTEQGLDTLLGFYAGRDVDPRLPDVKAQFQQNFIKMADRVPQFLKTISPEAELRFTGSVIQREIDAAYQAAAQTGNPADLKSAQWLDYGWTGQYKTELSKAQTVDPRRAELDAREQKLNDRDQANLTRDWTNFNKTDLEGKKWTDFYAEVDRVINPVKDHYKPGAWPHIRQGVINDVLAKLKEDKLWADEHGAALSGLKQAYDQRWRAGRDTSDLKTSIQSYVNDFMVRARRHLPSIAKTVLEDAPAKPAGATPANGAAKPPVAAQNGRAANGQFQKPAQTQAKNGQSKQQREAQLLDELEKLTGF